MRFSAFAFRMHASSRNAQRTPLRRRSSISWPTWSETAPVILLRSWSTWADAMDGVSTAHATASVQTRTIRDAINPNLLCHDLGADRSPVTVSPGVAFGPTKTAPRGGQSPNVSVRRNRGLVVDVRVAVLPGRATRITPLAVDAVRRSNSAPTAPESMARIASATGSVVPA